jgi:acyl-CoA reductase-like NAD-dependent aldehyde dehydrogenase
MKTAAGKKKVALELGGNAGVVVCESADFSKAMDRILMGAFAYSGQVCIHVQRIYIHASIFEVFKKVFVEKVRNLKAGNPLEDATEISSMIDEDNARRVESWVNEAENDGAKVLCGGKRDGGYFEPTVITDSKPQMKVCSFEIFGPVVTLEKFENYEEVIEEVNNSEYGLQAGVFTNKISEMDYAFDNLEVEGLLLMMCRLLGLIICPMEGLKTLVLVAKV